MIRVSYPYQDVDTSSCMLVLGYKEPPMCSLKFNGTLAKRVAFWKPRTSSPSEPRVARIWITNATVTYWKSQYIQSLLLPPVFPSYWEHITIQGIWLTAHTVSQRMTCHPCNLSLPNLALHLCLQQPTNALSGYQSLGSTICDMTSLRYCHGYIPTLFEI